MKSIIFPSVKKATPVLTTIHSFTQDIPGKDHVHRNARRPGRIHIGSNLMSVLNLTI